MTLFAVDADDGVIRSDHWIGNLDDDMQGEAFFASSVDTPRVMFR